MSRGCSIRDVELLNVDHQRVHAELEANGYVPALLLRNIDVIFHGAGDREVIWPRGKDLGDWRARLSECLLAIADATDECPRAVARRLVYDGPQIAERPWEPEPSAADYRAVQVSSEALPAASWPSYDMAADAADAAAEAGRGLRRSWKGVTEERAAEAHARAREAAAKIAAAERTAAEETVAWSNP
jgi:hypothetical protein